MGQKGGSGTIRLGSINHEQIRPYEDSVLTSLAILKTNWDERKQSFSDNFIPFVAEAARSAGAQDVSVGWVQKTIRRQFGIAIPQRALETILKRALRRGLVERRGKNRYGAAAGLREFDISRQRADALRQVESLVDRLITFAREKFELTIGREVAEEALLAHVAERAVPILRSAIGDAPLEVVPNGVENLNYVVSCFCLQLIERDPDGATCLETIVKGSMLASVLYLPDLGGVQRRFNNVVFYLDTPFLLGALGYEGPEVKEAAVELLELVKSEGGRLACFVRTVTEVRGVLDGIAKTLASSDREPRTGGVWDHCVGTGVTSSDVGLMIARLEKQLRSLGVKVEPLPAVDPALGVSVEELDAALRQEVGYANDKAANHDADVLAAVHALRGGALYLHLEDARAVFVTTNDGLVRGAKRFFDAHNGAASQPVAVSDHELATLAWLKKPTAAPELPRKQLIASCFAALKPDEALWSMYLDEIERLREAGDLTEDEIYWLKVSLEAKSALMDVTQGDPQRVHSMTVLDVLHGTREGIAAPLQRELDAERQRAKEAEDQTFQKAQQLQEYERQLAEAKMRAEEAESRASDLARRAESQRAILDERARRWAKRAASSVFATLGVLALALALPPTLMHVEFGPDGLRVGIRSVGLAALTKWALKFVGVAKQFPVKSVYDQLEKRLFTRFRLQMRKRAGVAEVNGRKSK